MNDKLTWLKESIQTLKGLSDTEVGLIDADTTLSDLGLDSLDVVELQMMYEEDVGYETPDEYPVNFSKVHDLLKLMI